MMNKRIILVGPAAGGKDYLKKKLGTRGFSLDVSYTTRPIRKGEEDGVDYHYISEEAFTKRIEGFQGGFYEWAQHGKYKYATGQWEWDNCDVFIMETDGIASIKPEDRKSCFVIYLDTPDYERVRRMRMERKWDYPDIQKRVQTDKEKFDGFKDYDLRITNPDF
jgi:guanylate kinase